MRGDGGGAGGWTRHHSVAGRRGHGGHGVGTGVVDPAQRVEQAGAETAEGASAFPLGLTLALVRSLCLLVVINIQTDNWPAGT